MSTKAATPDDVDVPKPASKLPLIIGGAFLMTNLAVTGLIGLRVMSGGGGAAPAGEHGGASKEHGKEGGGGHGGEAGPVVPLDTFVVNLNEPGSSRYLKVTFEMELVSEAAKKDLEDAKRLLRDDLLRYLSNLSVKDTLGEAGKAKMKDDIQERCDKIVGAGKVKHVFFSEFVVQ